MKKLFGIALITVLVATFAIGAVITANAKPTPAGDCIQICNRTTYQLKECCPYEMPSGKTVMVCQAIGWCYPE